jgi:hypothetical protein
MIKSGFAKLPVAALLALGSLGLSACATQEYVDQRIAEVNTHISAVEGKATDAGARADAANNKADAAMAKADQAMSADQAAQAAAAETGQKVDALSTQVNSLQNAPKSPRG